VPRGPEQRRDEPKEDTIRHYDAKDGQDQEMNEDTQAVVEEQQKNDTELEATAHADEANIVRELHRSTWEKKKPT
jgi:hypothetical protein